jgi:creatinine amidohydrolase
MKVHPKTYWLSMSRTDFEDLDTENTVAILPIAAVEQHGPHLPVSVDTDLAVGLVEATAARIPADLPATFLPVQAVGKSNEHIMSAGTLTLSYQTAYASWFEIAECVHRAGIRRLVIISSHGGNVTTMNTLARDIRVAFGMLVVATGWYSMGVPDGLYDPEELKLGIHGGDVETSMMLHLKPDLVDMNRAENFTIKHRANMNDAPALNRLGTLPFGWIADDLNDKGAVGDARPATAEKGRLTVDYQADRTIELLRDVSDFDLSILSPFGRED